jgi:hypothetical protein
MPILQKRLHLQKIAQNQDFFARSGFMILTLA